MAFTGSIIVIVFSAFIFFFEHGEKTEVVVNNVTTIKWMVEDCLCAETKQAIEQASLNLFLMIPSLPIE